MPQKILHANLFGKVTEEDLKKLEKELRAKLPPDYRKFMLTNNGGRPLNTRFSFEDDYAESEGTTREVDLEWFFAIIDPEREQESNPKLPAYASQSIADVLAEFTTHFGDSEILPIGRDHDGNVLVLRPKGGVLSVLDFYDRSEKIFFHLEKTFQEFLDGLRPGKKKPRHKSPGKPIRMKKIRKLPEKPARKQELLIIRDDQNYFELIKSFTLVVAATLNDTLKEFGMKDKRRREELCTTFGLSLGVFFDDGWLRHRDKRLYPLLMFSERFLDRDNALEEVGTIYAPPKTDEFHPLAVGSATELFQELNEEPGEDLFGSVGPEDQIPR